jgi:hypothetical protein
MTQNITNKDAKSSTPSFASKMVSALEKALISNAMIVSVQIDGISTRFDRRQALDELKYWKRLKASEDGTRPRLSRIKMS